MSHYILAVDAGFAGLGYAVIQLGERDRVIAFDSIITEKNSSRKRALRVADDDVARSVALLRGLREIVLKWKPAGAVVELPTGGARGARPNRCMGLATGIIAALPALLDISTEWVTPREVKTAAAGDPVASKEAVQAGVKKRFPEVSWGKLKRSKIEHAADAIGAFLAMRDGNGTLYGALKNRR